MTFLDRFLRDWRIKVIKPYVRPNDKILDIGCFDDSMFLKLSNKPIGKSLGIDPLLEETIHGENYELVPGKFSNDLPKGITFNCITMLAVLEHIPKEEQLKLNDEFYKYLEAKGRVIITVPSPFVDRILWVLSKLRLIDGMSLEEHYGFEAKDTPSLFHSKQFRLIKHKTFQLGLNNLFVFEKKD
ncbi:methyltransferase domain-containing protein [Winogradskyella sp.]|uniref:class I SAM-dependent methyltransferase n=1 Tax=Winogradskyella sp. TaxID=1883156 RepID=UPI0026149784|nr:methyltransferase domain-containing protein [Winogradskyella sp.]